MFFLSHGPGYLPQQSYIGYPFWTTAPQYNRATTREPTYGMVPDGVGFPFIRCVFCVFYGSLTRVPTSTELQRLSIMDYRAGKQQQQESQSRKQGNARRLVLVGAAGVDLLRKLFQQCSSQSLIGDRSRLASTAPARLAQRNKRPSQCRLAACMLGRTSWHRLQLRARLTRLSLLT